MAEQVSKPKIEVKNFNFYYGNFHALKNINLSIAENKVTAFIGPSGCGKSTLLRTFNRMYDLYDEQRAEGEMWLDGENIVTKVDGIDRLRAKVGMVFQRPTPFPMSIYENVAYGVRLFETLPKSELDDRVEWALKKAALWADVKDKLQASGFALSGGQQQRLCIARGIAVKPEVLLKDEYTVVIVTHSMQQAARISDFTAFMYLGELIEFGDTQKMFTKPDKKATEDYITGRFG